MYGVYLYVRASSRSVILCSLFQVIDPLPVIEHSQIDYNSFEKNFYVEHEDISKLTKSEVDDLRKKLNIRVSKVKHKYSLISQDHCLVVLVIINAGLEE